MPRTKRTLSEGTTNAKTPAAKKSAKGKNTGSSSDNASVGNISNTDADKRVADAVSHSYSRHSGHEGGSLTLNQGSTEFSAPKFVTICRPGWDTMAEKTENGEDSDSDEANADGWASADEEDDNSDAEEFEDLGEVELDDESDDEQDVQIDHGPDCMCKKPATEHPDWAWVFTEEGLKLFAQWQIQAEKRDQEAFGMYHYNDFTPHGLTEVMENQVGASSKN